MAWLSNVTWLFSSRNTLASLFSCLRQLKGWNPWTKRMNQKQWLSRLGLPTKLNCARLKPSHPFSSERETWRVYCKFQDALILRDRNSAEMFSFLVEQAYHCQLWLGSERELGRDWVWILNIQITFVEHLRKQRTWENNRIIIKASEASNLDAPSSPHWRPRIFWGKRGEKLCKAGRYPSGFKWLIFNNRKTLKQWISQSRYPEIWTVQTRSLRASHSSPKYKMGHGLCTKYHPHLPFLTSFLSQLEPLQTILFIYFSSWHVHVLWSPPEPDCRRHLEVEFRTTRAHRGALWISWSRHISSMVKGKGRARWEGNTEEGRRFNNLSIHWSSFTADILYSNLQTIWPGRDHSRQHLVIPNKLCGTMAWHKKSSNTSRNSRVRCRAPCFFDP